MVSRMSLVEEISSLEIKETKFLSQVEEGTGGRWNWKIT